MKHLRIQHFFNNPKNTAAVTSTQKIQIFEIQNTKKYSTDPCLSMCQVHPLGKNHGMRWTRICLITFLSLSPPASPVAMVARNKATFMQAVHTEHLSV